MSQRSTRMLQGSLTLLGLALSAQSPEAMRQSPAGDAGLTLRVLEDGRAAQGLDSLHSFRRVRDISDAYGTTHIRAQQYYQGLRVWGGELILRQSPQGDSEITTDALVRDLALRPEPSLGVAEVLAVAHQAVGPKAAYRVVPEVELVVLPLSRKVAKEGLRSPDNADHFVDQAQRNELAYWVHVELEDAADTRHEDLLIQAHTGEILQQWSSLHTSAQVGVGRTEYSGNVSINANSLSSGFELRDLTRAGNYTTNMGSGTTGNGTVFTNSLDDWGDNLNYNPAQPGSSKNGQTAAVDAHYGMQVTWDFLKQVLGRNGLDGAGRAIFSRVHYSSAYDNAFWSDACFCMTYGDGSLFKTLTALDVAAHEMGHGVMASTAKLNYYGESGGLNEANSDIFGTMVDFYAKGAGGAGAVIPNTGGNFTIGEQLETASFPVPLRYMYKPSLDGRSPDAWSASLGGLDVHYSSGPMNRAFYFLSQGASATTTSTSYSSYLPKGMTGLGNDKAFRIWWRAVSTKLTSTSDYLAARNGSITSARELYGANGAEEAAVWNAFAAINVGSAWTAPDTTAPVVSAKATGTLAAISFTATATDNVGVTRVDYYVDGVLKGSATATPYTYARDSTTVANGSHALVAKAADAAGNLGTSASVSFSVANPPKDTTVPVVSAKATGTLAAISFTATATDNVGVTRVDYYVDGVLKGSATASPYTYAWDSTTVANGSHALVAKAADAAGNLGTSASVSFSVANPPKDTTAPVISAKATGTAGSIAFTATATDNVGVTRVDYYVDGVLKGSATASPYTYAWDSTTVANGTHALVAKAADAAGNLGTSASVAFTVTNKDTTAPVVSAQASGTAGSITFTATATDKVGVTRVDYYVDGVLKGSATASPYTYAFSSTTVADGTHTLVAKAVDAAGNLGTSASVSFTVSNTPSTTYNEVENNNSVATANAVPDTATTIKGAISTGSDLDTFAIRLVAGKSLQITLTCPPGTMYGLALVGQSATAGLRGATLVCGSSVERDNPADGKWARRATSSTQVLTIPPQPASLAMVTLYIQVYSLTGVGSSAPYTMALVR